MSQSPVSLPMAGVPSAPSAPPPPPPAPAAVATDGPDVEKLAAALDEALGHRDDLEPFPRKILEDTLAALEGLHKAGLTAIVRSLRADPRGKELLFELVDDEAVRMILAMHGIIRGSDPMAVAEQVLETVRPGIKSHGGDVQLVRIEDGVAYVRLQGACNGCSMAGVTMRDGVEKALVEGVPGVTSVEVVENETAAASSPLQITVVDPSNPSDPSSASGEEAAPAMAETGWFKTFPVERIPDGKLEAMSLTRSEGEGVEVIVVNTLGKMAAYVNACAHQGMPLDKAIIDATEGTLTCPWHGFCYDATSGECLTMPGAQLEPLPLRIEDGHIWVRASS